MGGVFVLVDMSVRRTNSVADTSRLTPLKDVGDGNELLTLLDDPMGDSWGEG